MSSKGKGKRTATMVRAVGRSRRSGYRRDRAGGGKGPLPSVALIGAAAGYRWCGIHRQYSRSSTLAAETALDFKLAFSPLRSKRKVGRLGFPGPWEQAFFSAGPYVPTQLGSLDQALEIRFQGRPRKSPTAGRNCHWPRRATPPFTVWQRAEFLGWFPAFGKSTQLSLMAGPSPHVCTIRVQGRKFWPNGGRDELARVVPREWSGLVSPVVQPADLSSVSSVLYPRRARAAAP